jgi:hypothetical protein
VSGEPEPARGVWPSEEVRNDALNAYCLAVGQASYAWNDLHERLAGLYVLLTAHTGSTPHDPGNGPAGDRAELRRLAFSKWYAVRSDWQQRRMLRDRIEAGLGLDRRSPSPIESDILWLLDAVDALANDRNDAIHAPVSLCIDTREGGSAEVGPAYWNGNPRAKRLVGRKLLDEFDRCRATAILLSDFTAFIEGALQFPNQIGRPFRPELPEK